MSESPTLTYPQMFEACPGLTVRQCDYWSRVGYIRPLERGEHAGSGTRREWPIEEAQIARRMLHLINHGFNVETAALLARDTDAIGRMIWTLTKLALNGEHP